MSQRFQQIIIILIKIKIKPARQSKIRGFCVFFCKIPESFFARLAHNVCLLTPWSSAMSYTSPCLRIHKVQISSSIRNIMRKSAKGAPFRQPFTSSSDTTFSLTYSLQWNRRLGSEGLTDWDLAGSSGPGGPRLWPSWRSFAMPSCWSPWVAEDENFLFRTRKFPLGKFPTGTFSTQKIQK